MLCVLLHVQVVWPLSISELRRAAQRSVEQRRVVSLRCPSTSAPFGGMTWALELHADGKEGQGATIGLFCVPQNAPRDVWYRFAAKFEVDGAPQLSGTMSCARALGRRVGRGYQDMFEVGCMAGGWDEEAWAATGLPSEGELRLTLTVLATNCAGDMTIFDSDDSEEDSEEVSEEGD